MPSTPPTLIIGNYNTSSWSLRAWLVMRLAEIGFEEVRVPLRQAGTRARLAELSPSGQVPALQIDGVVVWDSLAIAELLAERHPGLWPRDAAARAVARSIAAEVHSGFADLRALMPLDVVGRFGPPGRLLHTVARDVRRVKSIWRTCRERHGANGPFLFGAFTIADAFMAPIASRFVTYGIDLEEGIDDYVDSLMGWPAMAAWRAEAAAEAAEFATRGNLDERRAWHDGKAGPPPAAPVAPPRAEPPSPPAEPPPLPEPLPEKPPEPPPRVPLTPRGTATRMAAGAVEVETPPTPYPPLPRAPRAEPPLPRLPRAEPPPPRAPREEAPARRAPPAPEPHEPPRQPPPKPPEPLEDLPERVRRWRPASSAIKSTTAETRRRR